MFGKKKDTGTTGPAPASGGKASGDAKVTKPVHPQGNVKLIGIAGLVKGEEFSIQVGESHTVGRSRDCNICLREVPKARELKEGDELLERHFNTVSRVHMRVTHHAPDNVEIEDLSSNGLFLDGKRVEGTVVLTDLPEHRHELKLGTHETFCIDWWRLVRRSEVKMVSVKVKVAPKPEGEEEGEKKEGEDEKK